jgi:alkanesulfonate monooxygenase SsuD/methylene tetrahydromethanopterin reductase-like flavin-dependent oxidoreductase (luciferase family)
MDFVMSMGKFRGFGGETDHWGTALESVTMMAGIAEATKNVRIWATIHPLLQNPAVAAKMIATLDHISGGRAGLNIVAGAYKGEFDQMGAWDDSLSHDDRYALTEEWTTVVKRLWSEDSVDFAGKFFTMKDCQSKPKPLSKPRPGDRLRRHVRPRLPVLGARGRRLLHRRPHARRAPRRLAARQEGRRGHGQDHQDLRHVHGRSRRHRRQGRRHGRALQGRRRHGRDPGHAGQLGRAGREAGHRRGSRARS